MSGEPKENKKTDRNQRNEIKKTFEKNQKRQTVFS